MSCRKGRVIYPSPLIIDPLFLHQHYVPRFEKISDKETLGTYSHPTVRWKYTDGEILNYSRVR